MRCRRATAMAALGAALFACGGDEPQEGSEDAARTREIMGQIYEAIRVALPASGSEDDFGDPANRAAIAAALDALVTHSELLEEHTRYEDAQMAFLARSVARDARDVRRRFAQGRYARAAFLMRQITENCVVCHTRLPDAEVHSLAAGFVDTAALDSMEPEPRATLEIATRRFDDALATLEGLLASDEHPALLIGPLTDYLVVCLRVRGDFERPVPVLRRFAERPDLWTRLRRDVETWIEAIPRLRARTMGPPDLTTARLLLDEAKRMSLFPGDHAALVHYVVAESILQRFIEARRASQRDLGEAYYLLGLIEARIGRNYWVTPAPFLLEKSIWLAPQEPFAEDAYALLEQELLASYEGSKEELLGADDRERLAALRSAIDAR